MASLWELFVSVKGDSSHFKQSIHESHDELFKFGEFAHEIGSKLVGYLAFAGMAEGVLQLAESFEKAGINIQRSTGATGHALEGLEESLKTLYVGSAQSAETIGTVLAKITQKTGATGEALEHLTQSALRFAKVTGTDVVASVIANEDVFAAWGVTIQQQAAALDVMYVATQKTGIGADVLSQSMISMGPALRNLGFGFTESVALISAFKKAGLEANDMVMGLNTAFFTFAKAGKEPKEALFALVDQMKAAATRSDALVLAMDAGFTKKTAGKFVDAVKSGSFALADLITALDKSGGAVDDMAKKTGTLGDAWTKFAHSVMVLAAPAGTGILEFATKSLQGWSLIIADLKGKFSEIEGAITSHPVAAMVLGLAGVAKGLAFGGGEGGSQENFVFNPKTGGFDAQKGPLKAPGVALPGGGPGGGEGAGSGSIPAYLKATNIGQLVGAEIIEKEQASFKKLVATLADYYMFGGKVVAVSSELSKVLDVTADVSLPSVAQEVEVTTKTFAQSLNPAIQASEKLMHDLGLTSTRELRAQYDAALKSTEAMILLGASQSDVQASAERVAEAHKRLAERLGEWDNQVTKVKGHVYNLGVEVEAMAHRMFDQLERGLAKNIVEWKGWATTLKDLAKTTAEDFLSIMLKGLFKPLEDLAAKAAKDIGTKLAGVFGGGGASAAGSAASSAGGIAGGVGGASSGIAGGASSLMGTIGAVSAAVGAVSSIIGNFQMAGMNKSLDLIENYTRYLKIGLVEQGDSLLNDSHMIRNMLSDFLKWNVNFVQPILVGMSGNLDRISGGGAGGKSGVTVNFYAPVNGDPQQIADAIADAIFSKAMLAGSFG